MTTTSTDLATTKECRSTAVTTNKFAYEMLEKSLKLNIKLGIQQDIKILVTKRATTSKIS